MVMEAVNTLLEPRPLPNFMETPFVQSLVERARQEAFDSQVRQLDGRFRG